MNRVSTRKWQDHHQYFVLKLNFSVVDPGGDYQAIRRSLFLHHLNIRIKETLARYRDAGLKEVDIEPEDGIASFQSLVSRVSQTPYKLYLLIDEHDNFSNEVMISPLRGTDRYHELVPGEGTIKTLFKAVKDGAERGQIDREQVLPNYEDQDQRARIVERFYATGDLELLCDFLESIISKFLTTSAWRDWCGEGSERDVTSEDVDALWPAANVAGLVG